MKTSHLIIALISTVLASPIDKRAGSTTKYTGGNTARDVENGVCAPLTVIFARGTSETGNIGTIIGPPLSSALSSKLNKHVALQGVNYPADLEGDLNMGASGAPNLVKLVNQALKQCPSTKIALSGYSQGGLVIHYALNKSGLSSSVVKAIAYFGDPQDGTAPSGTVPASKIKEYCAQGDGVCELHTFAITPAHLSYGADGMMLPASLSRLRVFLASDTLLPSWVPTASLSKDSFEETELRLTVRFQPLHLVLAVV